MSKVSESFDYTNNWFDNYSLPIWTSIFPQINPRNVLEIGAYEGRGTVWLIENLPDNSKITCVDTWSGGAEHQPGGPAEAEMTQVEKRFHSNTSMALRHRRSLELQVFKSPSHEALTTLTANSVGRFDFIYVDGSHDAPDVLSDAVLSFRLLRVGGVMAFDDYLWDLDDKKTFNPLNCPKIAIDAFTTIYSQRLRIISTRLYQLYIQKLSN